MLTVYVTRDVDDENVEIHFEEDIRFSDSGCFYGVTAFKNMSSATMGKNACMDYFGFYPEEGKAWLCTLSKNQEFWWIEKVEL